jgi:hypothetical protein
MQDPYESCLLSLFPGNIPVEEFAIVMKASGQNPTDAEVQQIIKEVVLDGDRTTNFEGKPAAHRNWRLAFRLSLLAHPRHAKFLALK